MPVRHAHQSKMTYSFVVYRISIWCVLQFSAYSLAISAEARGVAVERRMGAEDELSCAYSPMANTLHIIDALSCPMFSSCGNWLSTGA